MRLQFINVLGLITNNEVVWQQGAARVEEDLDQLHLEGSKRHKQGLLCPSLALRMEITRNNELDEKPCTIVAQRGLVPMAKPGLFVTARNAILRIVSVA